MKALSPGQSFGTHAPKKKEARKRADSLSTKQEKSTKGLDSGTLNMSKEAFDEFTLCMTEPQKPTKAILEGAALIAKLHKANSRL